ncbi:hypothetical protein Aca07nite_88220 [Actinoplanes capillaceus]|uniref:DUF397 domain-containing protein n=1 Tax=Actinoplanes campanulatus TaxID=113559 RepID=A0ABQ3WZ20_9ACTN|nr:DUF397 domain-containing protein [Actinoplanes capillaceus]GID51547.1 hypothetical protein Aca07nite_88220 [Actinoplanes capillaceus]
MTGLTGDWKKSKRSNGSDSCVEARKNDGTVQVRDTKDRSGPVLDISFAAWTGFLSDIRAGQFDE